MNTPTDIQADGRSLLGNTLYVVGGMAFFHLCQLAVVVALNKLTAPEVLGEYFSALAIAQPLMLLLALELRAAFVSDTHNRFTVGAYLTLRSVAMLVGTVLLAAIAAWRASNGAFAYAWLIASGVFAVRIAWSAAELGWGVYQRRERLDLLAASNMLRGVAALVPFAVVLPLLTLGAGWNPVLAAALAIWLHAAGFAVVHVLFDRPRVKDKSRWDLTWTPRAVGALAWQTLPLGIVALVINLCDSVPRWIFDTSWVVDGKRQLGYFGSIAYITIAGNLMMVQIATAAANRLAVYYRNDLPRFRTLVLRLIAVALVLGGGVLLLATLAGRTILELLFTPEFGVYKGALIIIAFGHCLALITNILGIATTQMRLFWVQVPVQVATLIGTCIAAVILIPGEHAVLGAAWTSFVRSAIQLALYVPCFLIGLLARDRLR